VGEDGENPKFHTHQRSSKKCIDENTILLKKERELKKEKEKEKEKEMLKKREKKKKREKR
jgi:hypothetical protein